MRRSSFVLLLLCLTGCLGRVSEPEPLFEPKPLTQAQRTQEKFKQLHATPKAENAALLRSDSASSGGIAPQAAANPAAPAVALLLPLSGKDKAVGQSMLDGALLALSEAGHSNIQLRPFDTQSTPAKAAGEAEKAVAGGAQLILGPLFASEARLVRAALSNSAVPVVSFSNDRTLANDGAYVLGIMPQDQLSRLIAYSISKGSQRFALLLPDNAFGEIMRVAAEEAIRSHGGSLLITERAGSSIESQTKALQRLGTKAAHTGNPAGFNALLLPFSGAELRTLAPLLPVHDINPATVKLLGLASWEDPKVYSEPALRGAWFAAAPRRAREQFETNYMRLHNKAPIRQASLAYDATALAVVIARANNGQFSDAWLKNASGYAGIDGIFRFTPDNIAERGLSVFEIDGKGSREIDAAPSRFESTQAGRR